MATMIEFNDFSMQQKFFPVGIAQSVFDPTSYEILSKAFPAIGLFKDVDPNFRGSKYSLSDVNNRENMIAFLKGNPLWQKVYNYFNSELFFCEITTRLRLSGVDLRLGKFRPTMRDHLREISRAVGNRSLPFFQRGFRIRFEFSALAASGGFLRPSHRSS